MEQESRGDYPDAFKWIGEIWELLRLQWTIPMLEQTDLELLLYHG